MVSHPKTPILNCFYHLLWFYVLTVSEISCLAKSFSVSGLTPLPHIPNQHHFTEKSAHEVLDTILKARVSPVRYLLCLSAALLCYTGFQTIH